MMYEGVLLFGVLFTADYLLDTLTQSRSGMMLRDPRQLWLGVAIGAYFVLCWRRSGQTLPMKTWNIRLVGRDGLPLSLTRLVLRYLLALVLPLITLALVHAFVTLSGWPAANMLGIVAPFSNFIGSWFDRDGQFLHDRLAGTRLVDVEPIRKNRRAITT
jgi:uncharacterized RDD family membrane protein YckC